MARNPIYQIHDPRFIRLIVGSARLEELYSGCRP
jgi:gluconolactonase